jgi:hypothetical protein
LQAGDVENAIVAFKKAAELENVEITAVQWNSLCWRGSLAGHAHSVIFACEQGVDLAREAGDQLLFQYLDSRGVARALSGDREGAINDFEGFVEGTKTLGGYDTLSSKREAWIQALKHGENPFDAETLEGLRRE